jgi:methyltransferase (TIGR00027 family)
MPISNVSDTARWVAVYRAMESKRPDALFRDPFAERLAGDRGHEIVNEIRRGRQMAWAMITRTAVFDEMIMDRVRNHGVDTVINLAAGLDARAWRLPLPPTLQWFDVDLPAMVEYKTTAMRGETPKCRYEAIAADLANPAERDEVLRRVGGVARTALVVTEGLLIYLGEENVTALAQALHAQRSIKWWITDLATPVLLQLMTRMWGKNVDAGRAPFRFGPEDSAAFFAPLGWRRIEFRSGMEEAKRLDREMSLMWLWRILSYLGRPSRRKAMKKMSGYALFERT